MECAGSDLEHVKQVVIQLRRPNDKDASRADVTFPSCPERFPSPQHQGGANGGGKE